jgi:CheY-like chemotaxis protein
MIMPPIAADVTPEAGATKGPEAPSQPTILIAEDHTATRFMLVSLLERQGFQVQAVGDGLAAQTALSMPDGPSIALLDWGLPHVSGLEVCRAVREWRRQRFVYMIVVTARDSLEDLATAFEAGADDFIRKPFDPVEILARLRSGQRIVELEHRLSSRIAECEAALDNVHKLKRLLPICMYCKKVRDDSRYWQEIELYIHEQTGTDFSHGICPGCMAEMRAGQEPAESRRASFRP